MSNDTKVQICPHIHKGYRDQIQELADKEQRSFSNMCDVLFGEILTIRANAKYKGNKLTLADTLIHQNE